MDIEEYERRGAERRANRTVYPRRPDRVTLAVGALLAGFVVVAVVWGVMS